MNFNLSEDQTIFQQVIRDFVNSEIRPIVREFEQQNKYPSEVVELMKGMGLFGLLIPSRYGGQEVDVVTMSIVFEEISKVWMGVAGILGSHTLACHMISQHGTEEQKLKYLPDLASGKRRTGIALTEPDAGSDVQSISTKAWRDGDDYIVRGRKMWITNARHADPLPVLVKTNTEASPRHAGMSILLIDQQSEGLVVSRDMGKLGYKGPETCEVLLDDVRVPSLNLLGGVEGRGMQQALSALEVGRINIAARAVGIASAALSDSIDYARKRKAFGQSIGEFQAVQLRIADMATSIEASRLLTRWAGSCIDNGQRSDSESGMAKLFASETAITCSLDAMRIHGGMGYSTELDIERYYRDAPLMAIGEGTNDILRTIIAKSLLKEIG
jgi:alkylation response protein AidB-like acyl-CoA dehydrogenase